MTFLYQPFSKTSLKLFFSYTYMCLLCLKDWMLGPMPTLLFFVKNWPLPASFSLFLSFQTVDSRQYSIKTLSMKGFEPRTSGVGSDSFCQLSHNHCPTYYYLYSSRKSFTGTFSAYVEIFWLKCWYKLHTEFLVDKSFMEESAGVNVWKELFKIF